MSQTTRCSWCGFDSKSSHVCDWCGRPISAGSAQSPAAAAQPQTPAQPEAALLNAPLPANRQPLILGGLIGVGLIAVIALGVMAFGGGGTPNRIDDTGSQQWMSSRSGGEDEQAADTTVASTRPRRYDEFGRPLKPGKPHLNTYGTDPGAGFSGNASGEVNKILPISGVEPRPPRPVSFEFTRQKVVRGHDGLLTVIGIATLKNTSAANVLDFRFEYEIGPRTYSVTPFEGSINHFRTLLDKTIPTRGVLKCPIRIEGLRGLMKYQGVLKMQAWLDDSPGTSIDEIRI